MVSFKEVSAVDDLVASLTTRVQDLERREGGQVVPGTTWHHLADTGTSEPEEQAYAKGRGCQRQDEINVRGSHDPVRH